MAQVGVEGVDVEEEELPSTAKLLEDKANESPTKGPTSSWAGGSSADEEAAALVELYNSTNGDGWAKKDGWCSSSPPSEWYGITSRNDRVTVIELPANNMVGTLPESICKLSALEFLQLRENKITGRIPRSLGQMKSLELIDMDGNTLTGELPAELGQCPKLEALRLAENRLEGPIPDGLGDCASMMDLELRHNRLTGTIPPSFGRMQNLRGFGANNNYLSGPVPGDTLARLRNLRVLYLHENKFSGKAKAQARLQAQLPDCTVRTHGVHAARCPC
jgi:hypothetical protein